MVKRLIQLFVIIFFLINVSFAATTLTIENDYGTKNYLLFIFLVALFLFWIWIYRFTTPLEFDRGNLLKSITNFVIKIVCWIWFIILFYVSQSVLFISTSESFLTDKIDLLYSVFYLTLILFGIIGLFNSVKLYNKMTNTSKFFKEFIYEIKTGGRK